VRLFTSGTFLSLIAIAYTQQSGHRVGTKYLREARLDVFRKLDETISDPKDDNIDSSCNLELVTFEGDGFIRSRRSLLLPRTL